MSALTLEDAISFCSEMAKKEVYEKVKKENKMAEYMMNFRATRLSADREIRRAIDVINTAIRSGSLVYLYELDNVNYSIKLRNPIGITMVDMPEIEVKDNG